MTREPNTQYVLSLSYGKDSLACLGAIEKLGWPLDRIVHAEIWATDTISADLPPMVEFKKIADKTIKERYGIEVEHICAMRGGSQTPTKSGSMHSLKKESSLEPLRDSLSPLVDGVSTSSTAMKLTYESMFYRIRKVKGGATRFTDSRCARANGATQTSNGLRCGNHGFCNPIQPVLHRGTQEIPNGFPMSVRRGNWCTALKTRVF